MKVGRSPAALPKNQQFSARFGRSAWRKTFGCLLCHKRKSRNDLFSGPLCPRSRHRAFMSTRPKVEWVFLGFRPLSRVASKTAGLARDEVKGRRGLAAARIVDVVVVPTERASLQNAH
jgi:hypothetical protein